MKLQYVDCYHCHSQEWEHFDTENGFSLVKCLGCGLLYVNPRPDEKSIAQAAKTGEHVGEKRFSATGRYDKAKVKDYLRKLEEFYPGGMHEPDPSRWLDIGAGNGEFVMALEAFGAGRVEARGLEPNAAKQHAARKRGLDVSFFDLETHEERYDGLSLLNVFSHLPNPVDDLKKWTGLLKQGGELLVQTGDSAGLARKDHHKPYFLPDHLSFASEEIVANILKRLGFEIIAVRKYRSPGYPRLSLPGVGKECLKLVWPGKRASFKFFPANPDIDMWIRARLTR